MSTVIGQVSNLPIKFSWQGITFLHPSGIHIELVNKKYAAEVILTDPKYSNRVELAVVELSREEREVGEFVTQVFPEGMKVVLRNRGFKVLSEKPSSCFIAGAIREGVQVTSERFTHEGYSYTDGNRIVSCTIEYVSGLSSNPMLQRLRDSVLISFDYPHSVTTQDVSNSSVQQTVYDKWQSITVGMTKSEVISLLGRPVEQEQPDGPKFLHDWKYGTVVHKGPGFPADYSFVLTFSNERVVTFSDPFGGVFSSVSNAPSKPVLISPVTETKFMHYPRIVDLRWYPCSGQYPMWYEVEIGTLLKPGGWDNYIVETKEPYLAKSFSGMTDGRWRVRGINSKGKGPWSGYFHFSFSQ